MGRLIDADKLLEETRRDRDYAEKNGFMDMYHERQALIERIEAQPTAYDPDKVVEQLEEEVKEYDKRIERRNGDCYFDETEKIKALEERARGIERAIEIAKGGGVDGN